MTTSKKIWIFDLDDTLHNASAHIFPVMNRAMTQYIMDELQLDEIEACQLRQHYWRIYGATLKGLMRHHGIDPHHFLHSTHQFPQLADMVVQNKRLRQLLNGLKMPKIVFTNAPKQYALRVLALMGIADCFDLVFSVENTHFHAKPSARGFGLLLNQLHIKASNCILLEDSLPALMTAKRLGMRTIWVSKKLQKPNFVDYRIPTIMALNRLHIS